MNYRNLLEIAIIKEEQSNTNIVNPITTTIGGMAG